MLNISVAENIREWKISLRFIESQYLYLIIRLCKLGLSGLVPKIMVYLHSFSTIVSLYCERIQFCFFAYCLCRELNYQTFVASFPIRVNAYYCPKSCLNDPYLFSNVLVEIPLLIVPMLW